MKAKLFVGLLLFGLGAYSPDLRQHAANWWNATPSSEAQKLIASLESTQGWSLGTTSGCLKSHNVSVYPGFWVATIYVDCADVSGSFSCAERHAINCVAACGQRKLVAQELDRGAAAAKSESEELRTIIKQMNRALSSQRHSGEGKGLIGAKAAP